MSGVQVPLSSIVKILKRLTQLVECLAYNEKVSGSSPLLLIFFMGALTLKAYSDELREWELIEVEGIDPTDSFGVSLRLSIREQQIFLAEPCDPNVPWITNKGRLFFDGMFSPDPSISSTPNWLKVFNDILEYAYINDYLNLVKNQKLSLLFVIESASLELISMLYLLRQSCSSIDIRTLDKTIDCSDFESSSQLLPNASPDKLRKSTLGLLLNTDTRHEGYALNLSLRQRFLKGGFKLLNIGSNLDLTFSTYNLGSNFNTLKIIGEGSHLACQDLKNSKLPLVVTNFETLKRSDSRLIYESFKYLSDTTSGGVSVLSNNLSNSSIATLSRFLPLSDNDLKNFYGMYFINSNLESSSNFKKLISLNLLNLFNNKSDPNCKPPIYIDQNVKKFNKSVISEELNFGNYVHLPSNLIFEDNETYFNTQGLIRRVTKVIHFKKDAKSNWQLIRKLHSNLKTLGSVTNFKDNSLLQFNCVNSFDFKNYLYFQFYGVKSLTCLGFYLFKQNSYLPKQMENNIKVAKVKVLNTKMKYWLDDYFNNNGKDAFSYNSAALVKSSKILRNSSTNFF